jgi:hypothetical protein
MDVARASVIGSSRYVPEVGDWLEEMES